MKRLTHLFEDDRLNHNFTEVMNNLSDVEDSISSLQQTVSSLQSTVNSLQNTVNALKTSVYTYAYLTADQTVSSGVLTVVNFDGVKVSAGSWSSGVWTAPYTGKVLVAGKIRTSSSWTSFTTAGLGVWKGADRIYWARLQSYEGYIITVVDITAGDELSIKVLQDSGSDQTIKSGDDNTFVIIYYLHREV